MSEKENVLDVYYLHVVSDVQSRFATTEIISRVVNHSGNAKEAHFVANLPNAAFITYFEMEVDGKVIVGEVKEKEKAKQVYEAAKFRGETAGHVAQQVRETSKFEISVNIKGGEEGKFKLVYQELLQRVRGVYKHQINIQPGQIVKDLQVDVHVSESLPFRVFHVPKFAGKLDGKSNKELLDYYKASDDVSIHMSSDKNHHRASVHWRPSEEKQREVCESGVLDGQLAILYDVDREEDTGQLQVVNGYFIHYFAPSKLEVGNKDIIFALDISGSMSGMKLQQTKEAMDLILSQLKEDDSFNIIAFDNETNFWKTSSMKASESNVADAKSWINNLHARGGTDIDSAVQEGIKQLVSGFKKTENALDQLIIILTDGQHNSGGLSRNDIGSHAVKVMKEKNKNVKVFGLAFGEYADFDLLKEIASKTGAVARKIYQDSDASLQLKNFYEEISSPLLANLKIRYLDPNIDPDSIVCNSSGDTYYDGSEMIYTGKLSDITNGSMTFETEIEGRGANGQFQRNDHLSLTAAFPDLVPPVPVADLVDCGRPEETGKVLQSVGDIVERSWAYLTIKSLLDKADSEQNSSELENMKKKALELSLKYHFVTGVTSMVAVQPSDGSSDSSHELSDKIRSLQTSTDDSCVCHVEPRLQTRRRPEDPLKRREMTLASDSYSDEVVGIMQMNLEKVLERDARLSQLDDRADALFATAASKERRKPWTSLFNSVSNLWPFGNTAAHGHPKEFISANTVQSSFLAPASATAPCKTEETKNVINKFLQGTKQEIDAEFTKITGNTDAQGTLFDFVKGNLISLLEILGKLLENSDTKNFTGNRIKEAIKKLKNGWEMTDLDVLICIIVAAQFSDDFMDEIFSSILVLSDGITLIPGSYPFTHFKDEKTLSVQRSDGNGQVRFDVPSGSIFDGLEVIFKLTKICHSSTPDGALALFKLLFETKADATGSPEELNEKLFLEIMKKFHEK